MIPGSCKRLAEVDFPIAIVSRHSAREKSIRHGHPSTLQWWAREGVARSGGVAGDAAHLKLELEQILDDLNLTNHSKVEAR